MATKRQPPQPAAPTIQSIEAAMDLVESKKEALKQAFDEFQSLSAKILSPSLSISWFDVDLYFSSVHLSLQLKMESVLSEQEGRKEEQEHEHEAEENPFCGTAESDCSRKVARMELRVFFQRMDGDGLIRYLVGHVKEREDLRDELMDAVESAENIEELVLSAVAGFHKKYDSERGKISAQRSCVMVLDVFMHMTKERGKRGESISVIVSEKGRERARSLAAKWSSVFQGKDVSGKLWGGAEVMAWLFLVGSFRLLGEHDVEDILEYCALAAHYTRSCEMCRVLDLEDRVPDIIQRLLKRRKQLLAVKFIINFGLQEKFPPVPLIEAHVNDAMKLAQKSQDGGNDSRETQKEATVRELFALKSALKVIKENGLESKYPIVDLKAHIQLLENPDLEKQPIKPSPQPSKLIQNEKHKGKRKVQFRGKEQLNGKKRPRGVEFSGNASIPKMKIPGTSPAGRKRPRGVEFSSRASIPKTKIPGTTPVVPTLQCSYPPTVVASADRPPYLISPPEPYHLVNSAPTATSYPGPSNGVYGLAGAPPNYYSEPFPPPFVYASENQTPALYYDRLNPYGGYAYPSHNHHSYYPL